VAIPDRHSELLVVDAERRDRLACDPPPGFAHPRSPLTVSVRIAPERIAYALDLASETLGVEPRARFGGLGTRDTPALVARARVVEDRVVQVERQYRRQGRRYERGV